MSSGDWERLNDEQRRDFHALRQQIGEHLQHYLEEQAGIFAQHHPELYLSWQFTCDANIRGLHDLIPL